jgi:hypothetical protein
MTRRKFLNTMYNSDNQKGFDYTTEGILMKKTVSPALYQNEKTAGFLDKLSNILVHTIEHVKSIKKTYMYAIDLDNNDFN